MVGPKDSCPMGKKRPKSKTANGVKVVTPGANAGSARKTGHTRSHSTGSRGGSWVQVSKGATSGLDLAKEQHLASAGALQAARAEMGRVLSDYDKFLVNVLANMMVPAVIYPLPAVHTAGFNSNVIFSGGLGPASAYIVMGNTRTRDELTPGFSDKWWLCDGQDSDNPYQYVQSSITSGKPLLRTQYDVSRGLLEKEITLTIPNGASSAVWWVWFDPEDATFPLAAVQIAVNGTPCDPLGDPDAGGAIYRLDGWTGNPFAKFHTLFAATSLAPFLKKAPLHKSTKVEVIPPKGKTTAPAPSSDDCLTEVENYIYTGGVNVSMGWLNKSAYTSVNMRSRSSEGTNPQRFSNSMISPNAGADLQFPDLVWTIPRRQAKTFRSTYRGLAWSCMHGWQNFPAGRAEIAFKKLSYALSMDFPFVEIELTTVTPNPDNAAAFTFATQMHTWSGVAQVSPVRSQSQEYITPCFGIPEWSAVRQLVGEVDESAAPQISGKSATQTMATTVRQLQNTTPALDRITRHPKPHQAVAQMALPAVSANPSNSVSKTGGASAVDVIKSIAGTAMDVIEPIAEIVGLIGSLF